jgi:Tol biopolymer transport system component
MITNGVAALPRLLGRAAVLVAAILVCSLGYPTRAQAATPGVNGLIAFSAATESAGVQLFTVRPNGEGLRQITHGPKQADNDEWAPDGRHIVFTLEDETTAQLAIARPDGSRLRLLPQPDGVTDTQASFSPDGRHIYFERFVEAEGQEGIWRMTIRGRHQRRVVALPKPDGFVGDPNLSPNGRTLLFYGFDGSVIGPPPNLEGARGLFTADRNGRHVRQIRPFTADEAIKGDWAPNGRQIAITENANFFHVGDSANIVTMRPDGSHVRDITNFHDGVTHAFFGSYSPDGRWIVFRLEVGGQFGLYRMHPDGSHRQQILPFSPVRRFLIDWGPRPVQ